MANMQEESKPRKDTISQIEALLETREKRPMLLVFYAIVMVLSIVVSASWLLNNELNERPTKAEMEKRLDRIEHEITAQNIQLENAVSLIKLLHPEDSAILGNIDGTQLDSLQENLVVLQPPDMEAILSRRGK